MKRYYKVIFMAIFVAVGGIIYSLAFPFDKDEANKEKQFHLETVDKSHLTDNTSYNSNEVENASNENSAGEKDKEKINFADKKEGKVEYIFVYITGCVKNAGVYKVQKDSRLCEAIKKAGGLLENANEKSINQARVLIDGEHVHIYANGEEYTEEIVDKQINVDETFGKDEKQDIDRRINLNNATKEELMSLPGIGESKANSIISYREENGKFSSIDEVMNVPGIKEAAFNKIKNSITV